MQKSIPCDEQEWFLFKRMALDKRITMKKYVHTLIRREWEALLIDGH